MIDATIYTMKLRGREIGKSEDQWTEQEIVDEYQAELRKNISPSFRETVNDEAPASRTPLMSFSYKIPPREAIRSGQTIEHIMLDKVQQQGYVVDRSDFNLVNFPDNDNEEIAFQLTIEREEIWNVGEVRVPTMVIHGVGNDASGKTIFDFTLNIQQKPTRSQIADAIAHDHPDATPEAIEEVARFVPSSGRLLSLDGYRDFYNHIFVRRPETGRIRLVIRKHNPNAQLQEMDIVDELLPSISRTYADDEIVRVYEFARSYFQNHPTYNPGNPNDQEAVYRRFRNQQRTELSALRRTFKNICVS